MYFLTMICVLYCGIICLSRTHAFGLSAKMQQSVNGDTTPKFPVRSKQDQSIKRNLDSELHRSLLADTEPLNSETASGNQYGMKNDPTRQSNPNDVSRSRPNKIHMAVNRRSIGYLLRNDDANIKTTPNLRPWKITKYPKYGKFLPRGSPVDKAKRRTYDASTFIDKSVPQIPINSKSINSSISVPKFSRDTDKGLRSLPLSIISNEVVSKQSNKHWQNDNPDSHNILTRKKKDTSETSTPSNTLKKQMQKALGNLLDSEEEMKMLKSALSESISNPSGNIVEKPENSSRNLDGIEAEHGTEDATFISGEDINRPVFPVTLQDVFTDLSETNNFQNPLTKSPRLFDASIDDGPSISNTSPLDIDIYNQPVTDSTVYPIISSNKNPNIESIEDTNISSISKVRSFEDTESNKDGDNNLEEATTPLSITKESVPEARKRPQDSIVNETPDSSELEKFFKNINFETEDWGYTYSDNHDNNSYGAPLASVTGRPLPQFLSFLRDRSNQDGMEIGIEARMKSPVDLMLTTMPPFVKFGAFLEHGNFRVVTEDWDDLAVDYNENIDGTLPANAEDISLPKFLSNLAGRSRDNVAQNKEGNTAESALDRGKERDADMNPIITTTSTTTTAEEPAGGESFTVAPSNMFIPQDFDQPSVSTTRKYNSSSISDVMAIIKPSDNFPTIGEPSTSVNDDIRTTPFQAAVTSANAIPSTSVISSLTDGLSPILFPESFSPPFTTINDQDLETSTDKSFIDLVSTTTDHTTSILVPFIPLDSSRFHLTHIDTDQINEPITTANSIEDILITTPTTSTEMIIFPEVVSIDPGDESVVTKSELPTTSTSTSTTTTTTDSSTIWNVHINEAVASQTTEDLEQSSLVPFIDDLKSLTDDFTVVIYETSVDGFVNTELSTISSLEEETELSKTHGPSSTTIIPQDNTTYIPGESGEVLGPRIERLPIPHDHSALVICSAVVCIGLVMIVVGIVLTRKVIRKQKKERPLVQPRRAQFHRF